MLIDLNKLALDSFLARLPKDESSTIITCVYVCTTIWEPANNISLHWQFHAKGNRRVRACEYDNHTSFIRAEDKVVNPCLFSGTKGTPALLVIGEYAWDHNSVPKSRGKWGSLVLMFLKLFFHSYNNLLDSFQPYFSSAVFHLNYDWNSKC